MRKKGKPLKSNKILLFITLAFVTISGIAIYISRSKPTPVGINQITSQTPKLDGSFLYTEYLIIPELKPLLQEYTALNMDTIVVARSRVKQGDCNSNNYRWEYDQLNKLKVILDQADIHGLKVYIGLTQPSPACDEFSGATNRVNDTADTEKALTAILALGNHPSLKGWYIPVEPSLILDWPNDVMEAWYAYFKSIVDVIHTKSNLPIVVSPMLASSNNKTPIEIAARAIKFRDRTGVNIQAWQDGGNYVPLGWQRPGQTPTYQLKDYMDALSSALGPANFWANNELFGFTTPDPDPWNIQVGIDWDLYRPASFTRIKNQLLAESAPSKRISWLQSTMLTKSTRGRFKEADRLYDTYAAYFGRGDEYVIPQSVTWITSPQAPYLDPQNTKLFDGVTGDNRNYLNPNWVGVNGKAQFVVNLGNPKNIYWFGVHSLNNKAAGISFPDSMMLECSQNNVKFTRIGSWNLGVHQTDADYLFANPTKLDVACQYVRVTLPNPDWTFLSELEIVGKSITNNSELASVYNGYVVKGTPDTAYLMENGKRRGFPDFTTFQAHNFTQPEMIELPDSLINAFPNGEPIQSVLNHAYDGKPIKTTNNNTVYLVQDGVRHRIPDWDTFLSLKFSGNDIMVLPDATVYSLPDGSAIQPIKN